MRSSMFNVQLTTLWCRSTNWVTGFNLNITVNKRECFRSTDFGSLCISSVSGKGITFYSKFLDRILWLMALTISPSGHDTIRRWLCRVFRRLFITATSLGRSKQHELHRISNRCRQEMQTSWRSILASTEATGEGFPIKYFLFSCNFMQIYFLSPENLQRNKHRNQYIFNRIFPTDILRNVGYYIALPIHAGWSHASRNITADNLRWQNWLLNNKLAKMWKEVFVI
jgi:hypothetical protein